MSGFGARLVEAKASRGPLCLGIDPHPELLRAWDLPATADGLAAFCDACVEAFAGFAVVKPQVAFFEAYGSAGYAVLERTIAALRSAGVLVLADAKRGDIGTTMAAYAAAWAADSPLAADAVTASPYLGFGSLRPLLEAAAAHDRGVFVLAATSNPEGGTVQRATFDGRTVAQLVIDQAALVNREANRSAESGGARLRRRRPRSDGLPTPGRERPRRTSAGARGRSAGREAGGARWPGRGTAGSAAARGGARGAARRAGRGRAAGGGPTDARRRCLPVHAVARTARNAPGDTRDMRDKSVTPFIGAAGCPPQRSATAGRRRRRRPSLGRKLQLDGYFCDRTAIRPARSLRCVRAPSAVAADR